MTIMEYGRAGLRDRRTGRGMIRPCGRGDVVDVSPSGCQTEMSVRAAMQPIFSEIDRLLTLVRSLRAARDAEFPPERRRPWRIEQAAARIEEGLGELILQAVAAENEIMARQAGAGDSGRAPGPPLRLARGASKG